MSPESEDKLRIWLFIFIKWHKILQYCLNLQSKHSCQKIVRKGAKVTESKSSNKKNFRRPDCSLSFLILETHLSLVTLSCKVMIKFSNSYSCSKILCLRFLLS